MLEEREGSCLQTHAPRHSIHSSPAAGMSRMAPLWIIVFVTSVLRVSGKFVNLNDTVQFTVSGSCAGGEMQLDRLRRTDHISRTLARLVGGVWEPAEDYKDRIRHVSASSVNLTRANFNDDAFYEFNCKNDLITSIDVSVIVPYDGNVSEGDTARIPCHFSSEGIQVAWWEKNGEPVLVQNRSSGQPEGRLSVSPDWVQTGDFSLTVKDAQLEDGGNFVCYTKDGNGKKTRGSPAAVKLTVQRSRPAPTCPPQQVSPLPQKTHRAVMGSALVVVPVCQPHWSHSS